MSASDIDSIIDSISYYICKEFLENNDEQFVALRKEILEKLNKHYKEIYPNLKPIESALISDFKIKDTIDIKIGSDANIK